MFKRMVSAQYLRSYIILMYLIYPFTKTFEFIKPLHILLLSLHQLALDAAQIITVSSS